MPTVNQVTIGGSIVDNIDISGGLSNLLNSVGILTNQSKIYGTANFPETLDRTAIHYDTTEAWNSSITFIAERGHIYIYSDCSTKELEDGSIVKIPGLKIGDGTSYLIDMPFVSTGNVDMFIEHMENQSIHVSETDRPNWDNKVSASVDQTTESLILSI